MVEDFEVFTIRLLPINRAAHPAILDCNRIIAANKKAAKTKLIYTPRLGEQLKQLRVAWRHHRRGVISPALP